MRASQSALLDRINDEADYNDEIENSLKAAIEDFKATGTW